MVRIATSFRKEDADNKSANLNKSLYSFLYIVLIYINSVFDNMNVPYISQKAIENTRYPLSLVQSYLPES